MNKKRTAYSLVAAVVVALAIVLLVWQGSSSTATGPTRIAFNLPLTGFLAPYGVAIQDGAQMAMDDLADQTEFATDWQDNASEPKTAATVFQSQQLRGPQVYVTGLKPQVMAIETTVAEAGLPHFVWILDPYIKGSNLLRPLPNYAAEGEMYIQYTKTVQPSRVAIAYVQLPHTITEFEQIVLPGMKDLGITEFLVEPLDMADNDFSAVASKFKAFKPDLVILSGFQPHLVALVRALRPQGVISDSNTIATFDMLEAAEVLGADELEGIRVVVPKFTVSQDEKTTAWSNRFQERTGKQAGWMNAYGYDMIQIIADAKARVADPASSEQWIQALRATDIQGVTGPLRFDESGSLITPLAIGVFRDGAIVEDAKE